MISLLAVQFHGANARCISEPHAIIDRLLAATRCAIGAISVGDHLSISVPVLNDQCPLKIHSTGITEGWSNVTDACGQALIGLWAHHMITPFHGVTLRSHIDQPLLVDIILFTVIVNSGGISTRTALTPYNGSSDEMEKGSRISTVAILDRMVSITVRKEKGRKEAMHSSDSRPQACSTYVGAFFVCLGEGWDRLFPRGTKCCMQRRPPHPPIHHSIATL